MRVWLDDDVRDELEAQARSRGIGLSAHLHDLATQAARQAQRARIRQASEAVGGHVDTSADGQAFYQGWGASRAKLLADLAASRVRTEAEIEAEAAEDGGAWTEEELAAAVVVHPPPTAEQVRALRVRLGLSQAQFASRFGFTVDTLQQYEQGRRVPSGPASTLLRVIEADPEAVIRALHPSRAVRSESAPTPG